MDLVILRALVEPFVTLTMTIIVSGVGVAAVTQILKDYRIPVPATKYPRLTSAVLSVVATLISLYVVDLNILLVSGWHYAGLGVSILVASAFSYNILFKGLQPPKASE